MCIASGDSARMQCIILLLLCVNANHPMFHVSPFYILTRTNLIFRRRDEQILDMLMQGTWIDWKMDAIRNVTGDKDRLITVGHNALLALLPSNNKLDFVSALPNNSNRQFDSTVEITLMGWHPVQRARRHLLRCGGAVPPSASSVLRPPFIKIT